MHVPNIFHYSQAYHRSCIYFVLSLFWFRVYMNPIFVKVSVSSINIGIRSAVFVAVSVLVPVPTSVPVSVSLSVPSSVLISVPVFAVRAVICIGSGDGGGRLTEHTVRQRRSRPSPSPHRCRDRPDRSTRWWIAIRHGRPTFYRP